MKSTAKNHSGKQSFKLSPREIAVEILIRVEQEQAYSNLLLNEILRERRLDRQDAALATELVYGTIQRMNTIDYFLNPFIAKGLNKLAPWVRGLLRISFYQLHYLDRIPDHAIVNEAVNIAKRKGHQGISGLVNGVLRNLIRHKDQFVLPTDVSAVTRIALEHSHPEWMVRRWIAQWDESTAEAICAANNAPPKVSLRVNTTKHTVEQMMHTIKEANISVEHSSVSPFGIIVDKAGNMADTIWYRNGDISLQDESSMLVAEVVDPQPGMSVLDCCAAPGGKTSHMAELMHNRGAVWANDIHEHKERLIRNQLERLAITCVTTIVSDALLLHDNFEQESFDRILLDAPCSGLGVIRRKPDLKWKKSEAEMISVAKLQTQLLESVHKLLRPGGLLIYSTCTLEYEENQAVIRDFLDRSADFEMSPIDLPFQADYVSGQIITAEGYVQILPHQFQSDGFFIARLRKINRANRN